MGNIAKNPYVLKNPGIPVYTIEEFCYCVKENAFLIEESIISRELVDWIRDECGLTQLADSLYVFLRMKSSLSAFLATILEYVGFYTPDEIKAVEQFLKTGDELDEYEKKKKAADYLVGIKRYGMAAEQYHRLLLILPEEYSNLRGRILHNLGYLLTGKFLFEEAAKLFEQAYQLTGEKESMLQALAARRLYMDEQAYIVYVAERSEQLYDFSMEVEMRVEALTEKWRNSTQMQELENILLYERSSKEEYEEVLKKTVQKIKELHREASRES